MLISAGHGYPPRRTARVADGGPQRTAVAAARGVRAARHEARMPKKAGIPHSEPWCSTGAKRALAASSAHCVRSCRSMALESPMAMSRFPPGERSGNSQAPGEESSEGPWAVLVCRRIPLPRSASEAVLVPLWGSPIRSSVSARLRGSCGALRAAELLLRLHAS